MVQTVWCYVSRVRKSCEVNEEWWKVWFAKTCETVWRGEDCLKFAMMVSQQVVREKIVENLCIVMYDAKIVNILTFALTWIQWEETKRMWWYIVWHYMNGKGMMYENMRYFRFFVFS